MFKKILTNYLLIWLTLACALGCYWNKIFGENAFNPFHIQNSTISANLMSSLIALTMLAVGSLLPAKEVKEVAKRWYKTLAGTAVQYVSMPLLAYCVAKGLGLEGAAFAGVILAGCVPGAMASNVLTLTARGNVSYSVGLTTSATLLSPLVVPFTLGLCLRQQAQLPFDKIMLNLLLTVVLPVCVGFALAQFSTRWRKGANRFAEILANLTIIWIIASAVSANVGRATDLSARLFVALIVLNLGGYLAGYFGGWAIGLNEGMRRALTIEVGMQNAGLGTALATKFFPDQPETSLFCACYSFGCMFTGIILALAFRRFSREEESNADSTETQA